MIWMVRETADGGYRASPGFSTDPDRADELGDQLVALAAAISGATAQFLTVLAEFDRLRGWEPSGQISSAHWLARFCDIDLVTAREKVRVARKLAGLPLMREAMAKGELSFSQARALTRAATVENEGELLELSRELSIHQLERGIRGWKKGERQDDVERERARYEARRLAIHPDDEGNYTIRGTLTPEVGAAVMRAIEAACDALYRRNPDEARARAALDPEASRRAAARRRADALGLLAERALAAGFGEERDASADAYVDDAAPADASAEAHSHTARPVPISGSRAERYQVVLHVDAETLSEDGGLGRSELEDGVHVSAEASRRLACDAGLVNVAHRADGSVLRVGRTTRTVPPALRRALEIRDRGCRFPGCGLRFTDAHHVKHWADGGETSLDNCLLLCRHHHRLVHECGWTLGFDRDRRPVFFDPRGGVHYEARPRAGTR